MVGNEPVFDDQEAVFDRQEWQRRFYDGDFDRSARGRQYERHPAGSARKPNLSETEQEGHFSHLQELLRSRLWPSS